MHSLIVACTTSGKQDKTKVLFSASVAHRLDLVIRSKGIVFMECEQRGLIHIKVAVLSSFHDLHGGNALGAEQPPGKAEVDSVANAEGIIEPAPTPPPGGAGQLMRNAVAAVARPMSAVASTIGKVSKKTAVGMQKSVGKVSEVTSIGVQKTVNVVTFKGFRQQPISEDESPKASPAHSMQRTSSKRTLSDMVDASPNASPCHSMQCTSSKRTLSDMDMGCPTESPSSFTNVGVRTQTLGQGSELNSSTPPAREDGSVDMQIQSKLPKRPSVGTNLANVASEALCIETEDGRDTELFMF